MSYIIEHGILMPVPNARYPFALMKLGDSFSFDEKELNSVRNSSAAYGKRHDQKFRCRQLDGAWRCWRTA
jgi:hypothetical protein